MTFGSPSTLTRKSLRAIVLNVLMAIAGVGLLGLAEWGRRLAIGVAWLKIVRWVAMIMVTFVLILPITAQKTQKMFDSIQAQAKAQAQAKSGGRGAATMPMMNIAASDFDCGCNRDDLHRLDLLYLSGALTLVSNSAANPRSLFATSETTIGPARDATGRTGVNLATLLFGHLAGTECRRALARGWLIVVRSLVGLLLAVILLFSVWAWWFMIQYQPVLCAHIRVSGRRWRRRLSLLTIVVVQAPAVLAGSLAGDRERGVLQLLLDHRGQPARDRVGATCGQAEPGRDDPARRRAIPGNSRRMERS